MVPGNSPSRQSFCSDPLLQEAFARRLAINSANGEYISRNNFNRPLVCVYFVFSNISATESQLFFYSLSTCLRSKMFIYYSLVQDMLDVLCFYSFFVVIESFSVLRAFCEIWIILLIVRCSWYNWNTGRLDWPTCQSKRRNNQAVSTNWRSVTLLSSVNALLSNLLHSRFSG